jgi:hypothetical protein
MAMSGRILVTGYEGLVGEVLRLDASQQEDVAS